MISAFYFKYSLQMLAFYNGIVFNGDQFSQETAVLIHEGKILDLIPATAIPADIQRYDLKGAFLVPAFIDIQLYGAGGLLFSQEQNAAALKATDEYCMRGGCSRFLITMATNTIETMLKGMEVIHAFQQTEKTGLLGLHMEGPYINPIKKGAHLEHCIKAPTLEEVQHLIAQSKGVLKMMTLAPERCSKEVVRYLIDQHVIVSAGHTNATYQEATTAFQLGINAVTHLFNAMSPFQGREPGMVGAVYDHPTVCSSIVCDGVHTAFDAVRISKKIMQERLFLITDAVTTTAEGAYQHLLQNDRYTLPDGTLSGSALTMIKAVANCIDHVGITFEESLRMASLYPARVAGLDQQFGKIEKGFTADLLVLTKERSVKALFRDGNAVLSN